MIDTHHVTSITIVGDAMMRPLLDVYETSKSTFTLVSLLGVGNGGAPLSPAIRSRINDLLPNVVVSDSAGSSETGAQMYAVSSNPSPSGQFRQGPGTVVLNAEKTGLVHPGSSEEGWLAQIGPVPLGYLNDPEKTASTFFVLDHVRYAVPGDRARLLENGEIALLGRDAVTINSGGEKIYAEEVEKALLSDETIQDVVVVGRPSATWGEEVVAIVALTKKNDGAETKNSLIASIQLRARDHIAGYKIPKDVLFVDAIVRSPSGKADYRWAKDQIRSHST
jgi:acyl-CoA synthetase (AMP-forming)/AMP-acid ligase II